MGASAVEIGNVQRQLGVTFPEDYRRFLIDEGAVDRSFPPAEDFLQVHRVLLSGYPLVYEGEETQLLRSRARCGDPPPGRITVTSTPSHLVTS